MDIPMQIVGLMGAALLLLAYFNNSQKRWMSNSKEYQLVNLAGAVLIVINTFYFGVYGPLFLNICWALIAMNGLRKGLA